MRANATHPKGYIDLHFQATSRSECQVDMKLLNRTPERSPAMFGTATPMTTLGPSRQQKGLQQVRSQQSLALSRFSALRTEFFGAGLAAAKWSFSPSRYEFRRRRIRLGLQCSDSASSVTQHKSHKEPRLGWKRIFTNLDLASFRFCLGWPAELVANIARNQRSCRCLLTTCSL